MKKLTAKHANIQKEMRSIMVGQVLDYEAKRILNQGIERGKELGRQEGRKEGITDTLVTLAKRGLLSINDAADEAGMSEETFRKTMNLRSPGR